MLDREIERVRELARAKAARDADVFDERGIIRDGKRLRVAMTDARPMPLLRMSTGPSRQSSEPLVISTGLTGEYKLSRFFYADGTAKPSRQVRDRERERQQKAPQKKDAAALALDAAMNDASHKPGFRYGDADRTTTNDAVEA